MPTAYVRSLSKKHGVSVEKGEERWAEAKAKARERGFEEGTPRFYKYTMSIFKSMMGEKR